MRFRFVVRGMQQRGRWPELGLLAALAGIAGGVVPAAAGAPGEALQPVVLSDGAGGLALMSAPAALQLWVGQVAYLPVEVQGYHRPVAATARTLIHTFVNGLTPESPGEGSALPLGALPGAQSELELQTLRMRAHELALAFTAGGDEVTVGLTIEPAVQPHTPLFGIHLPELYNGVPEPFDPVYGPDCSPCPTTPGDPPGTTRDRACAKGGVDSCSCHRFSLEYNAPAAERIRAEAPAAQAYASQFLRTVGGWTNVQTAPASGGDGPTYLWSGLDWSYSFPTPAEGYLPLTALERDYSPLYSGIMSGDLGWVTCPAYVNLDGSTGFFDPGNTFLVEQYTDLVRSVGTRYAGALGFLELANEPAAEFYFCPCLAPGGESCDATTGRNQPVCLEGTDSPGFARTYGPILHLATSIAATEMAAAAPGALVITGALEMTPSPVGLSSTTEAMIRRGLLDATDNVAIGIHQYPYFNPPSWIRKGMEETPACRNSTDWLTGADGSPLNCAYYQEGRDIYWLPCGCETAPPLAGSWQLASGRVRTARELWREQDERIDSSTLLRDADALGVLDRFYLFDSELHAGFKTSDPTTTASREALAGLRFDTINAHQRVLGTEHVLPPAAGDDAIAAAYNLMVKHLAGATPVYRWDAPLIGADYSGLVYKLFTRGGEDIIAAWSNAEAPLRLLLTPAAGTTAFRAVTLTRLADDGGEITISTSALAAPPPSIQVTPLGHFFFLSVISDRPGFGWLAGLATAPAPRLRRHLGS